MNTDFKDRISRLDFWSAPVDPRPLAGGITNTNFIVDHRGERFVVRVGKDIPVHGVMRFNEIAAARAAHAAGISPEIVYSEDGLFIMRYIDGTPFSEEDVQKKENLAPIVSLLRACHTQIPKHFKGPALVFWPFHVCRNYIHTAQEGKSRMMPHLPRFLEMNETLEKRIGEIHLVFGHNDLLAANFIHDNSRLWLLDWDYAGYNTALFDLANLSSNNALSLEQEEDLLETYYQRHVTDTLRRRFAVMKCVSLLRETLWSIVSELYSTLDFDYVHYTGKNLSRLEKAYDALQQMD